MHCGPIHLRISPERLFDTTFIMRECLGKALWLCFCLSITGCAEDDRMTPLSADSGDTADELIPIHISLTGDNDYHSSSFNDASTRSHSPLIADWKTYSLPDFRKTISRK